MVVGDRSNVVVDEEYDGSDADEMDGVVKVGK